MAILPTKKVTLSEEGVKPAVSSVPPSTPQQQESKKEVVTMFRSKSEFILGTANNLASNMTFSGKKIETTKGDSEKLYASKIEKGRISSVVLVPGFTPGSTIDIDDPKYETLPAEGWKLAERINVYVFKSEFGTPTSVSVAKGEGAEVKSIEDLKKAGYWKIVNDNSSFVAKSDIDAMVKAGTVDSISELFRTVRDTDMHKDYIENARKGEQYPSGWILGYIGYEYTHLSRLFDALPESTRVSMVDKLGPEVFKQTKDLVGDTVVRKYLVELTWQQVVKINPADYKALRAEWPHDDPNIVVTTLGYNKDQYNEMARVCLFWQRRGQAVFERAKLVASRQVGAAPQTGGSGKIKKL